MRRAAPAALLLASVACTPEAPPLSPKITVKVIDVRIVEDEAWAVLTIAGEALGEPFAGKLAVAEVIRNRMKRRYASDGTVIGTVLRPKQFSMWNNRSRQLAARLDDAEPAVQDCIRAWRESATSSFVRGAVLYHTVDVEPYWSRAPKVRRVRTVARHHFYTDGGWKPTQIRGTIKGGG